MLSQRQIFLDGGELERLPPNLLTVGYSTSKTDGDTLVVDTHGFNGKRWLDQTANPRQMRCNVTERFRRMDFGHAIHGTIWSPSRIHHL